jgi:competence protein ComEC
VKVDTIYLPVGPGADKWEEVILERTEAKVVYVDEIKELAIEDGRIRIFDAHSLETSNESSLSVLFQKENYDILITGDRPATGEMDLIASGLVPKLEVLVAGHHGAASSTSELLLSYTEPDTVLISVGADNSYGHPDGTVLARLERYGCEVRRTDLEGTIVIRR